ncbi:MAG: hypothetical protein KDD35_02745 [Bdellovibrionales bacterium]|nr:hypothetical protein [Bdellovibrionales bacterium]
MVEDRGELADGWHQFRVSYRDAVEFILRKDYRNTYAAEIKEEYTFMNQSQYEDMFRNAGFRVLHSSPIYNAWIIENRFQGKVRIKGLDGREMPFPATNYVIVGEKIPNNWGVRIVEQSSTVLQESRFLTRKAMKDRRSGQIFDLVGRPHQTIDLLPYFKRKGKIFVLGKQGFPRPIITSLGDDQHLDGIRNDGYMVEPISFIWDGRSPRFESIERELEKRAGVSKGEILQRGSSQSYEFFVSPGLVAEKVTSLALGVKSRSGNFIDVPNYTDLSSAGSIRPIDAQQVLRSAQAGSVLDARMEIATYNLMLDSRVALGPWIGSEIQLVESPRSPHILDSIVNLLNPKQRRRVFVAEDSPSFGSYLEIKRGSYLEQDGRGNILNRVEREYVVPREMSSSVVSILPVLKSKGKIYVGLEKRHLPGVQANEGFSDIVVNPAWRIPKSIKDMDSAKKFVKDRLFQDMGVVGSRIFSLGGPYHPSPGISPEVVHSFAVEIIFDRQMKPSELKALSWVALDELLEHRSLIRDAHLFVASLRLAHALGVIK